MFSLIYMIGAFLIPSVLHYSACFASHRGKVVKNPFLIKDIIKGSKMSHPLLSFSLGEIHSKVQKQK